MYQKLFLIVFIHLLISPFAFASEDVCQSKGDSLYCSAGEVSSIFHMGNTILSGTHVLHSVRVLGDLDAHKADMENLTLMGKVNMTLSVVRGGLDVTGECESHQSNFQENAKITGNLRSNHDSFQHDVTMTGDLRVKDSEFKSIVDVTGSIQADGSVFDDALNVQSCLIEFSQVKTKQIIIKNDRNCAANTQSIYLKNRTEVSGNIHFVGGNGKVFISKDSVINGQVIGGVVVRE